MSLWIKICGNTSLEDAQLAAAAGADAVGFVFAPSPRRVTPQRVAAIVPLLPSTLEKIGVFVDATADEIVAAAQSAGLTGVQLHFAASPELQGRLRQRLGSQMRILRVVHFGAATADESAALADDENLDGLLIDSKTAAALGGTGVAFDWEAASTTLFQSAKARKRLIAAGGLGPQNVAEAIRTLKPWGVDAVSGVEAAPGRKDPAKVRAFIANARAARR
jgi:phosphoribosylanthranilate isomerase